MQKADQENSTEEDKAPPPPRLDSRIIGEVNSLMSHMSDIHDSRELTSPSILEPNLGEEGAPAFSLYCFSEPKWPAFSAPVHSEAVIGELIVETDHKFARTISRHQDTKVGSLHQKYQAD